MIPESIQAMIKKHSLVVDDKSEVGDELPTYVNHVERLHVAFWIDFGNGVKLSVINHGEGDRTEPYEVAAWIGRGKFNLGLLPLRVRTKGEASYSDTVGFLTESEVRGCIFLMWLKSINEKGLA